MNDLEANLFLLLGYNLSWNASDETKACSIVLSSLELLFVESHEDLWRSNFACRGDILGSSLDYGEKVHMGQGFGNATKEDGLPNIAMLNWMNGLEGNVLRLCKNPAAKTWLGSPFSALAQTITSEYIMTQNYGQMVQVWNWLCMWYLCWISKRQVEIFVGPFPF